jgi:MFS family permease
MASHSAPHLDAAERPTRVRYWVIVFAVTLAIVTYIDRVCISQAAAPIRADMGFSEVEMGYVFGAFTLGYALFEIPGGVLGDWIGARKVLMRIVIWWSALTAATGYAWNYLSMLVIRFLFGAGEAGCFPNLTKAFTVWLPHDERVRAQGILWMSARWGGAFTPFLVYQVLQLVNWRQAFIIFGAIGVVWALIFYAWYKDKPRDNKSLNAAELRLLEASEHFAESHGNIPWGLFVGRMAALHPVFLPLLRLVLLHYVAPHVPEAGARPRSREGRSAGGAAALPRRRRIGVLRPDLLAHHPRDRQRREDAQARRHHRLRRRLQPPADFDADGGPGSRRCGGRLREFL